MKSTIKKHLESLLEIPSPSGYTDRIVMHVSQFCENLGLKVEMTRRGALRVVLPGENPYARAIVAHVDTLGAMVKGLKDNGRLSIVPIGHWNARFAEGAKVTIFTDSKHYRGTILPLKASGHTYNTEVDSQPSAWDNLEVRIDEICDSKNDLIDLGFHVGDFIGIDPQPEFNENGFINSRHLDNKAGVACVLTLAQLYAEKKWKLPITTYLLFTITEEVGSGASTVLHGDIAELVSIDNATPAPIQNSIERGVTVGIMDSSGPFDYHLTHFLLDLCKNLKLPHARDVFRYYRTDAASAVEAGNDIRTSLVCFGADGSHGWERSHIDSLEALTKLLIAYVQCGPVTALNKPLQKVDSEFFEDNAQIQEGD